MATPINWMPASATAAAAQCGDGFVHAGVEACDDGNRRQTDGCLNNCVIARCGDGHVRAGVEACDDANRVNTDACTNACRRARCGDGIVRADEKPVTTVTPTTSTAAPTDVRCSTHRRTAASLKGVIR